MKNRRILYTGLILSALLSGLNLLAFRFYLYWPKDEVFAFDTFMHFLGGLTLGVLALWFFGIERGARSALLLILGTVMVLGGVWEVFEYVFDLTGITGEFYWIDTIHDLVMDGLGAVGAYLLYSTKGQTHT